MAVQSLDRHIEVSSDTLGGKPRIAGRRITVQDVAIWQTRLGRSVDEICSEHDLHPAEVHAALAYYFDHRAEIDLRICKGDALVEALRGETSSVLHERLRARVGE